MIRSTAHSVTRSGTPLRIGHECAFGTERGTCLRYELLVEQQLSELLVLWAEHLHEQRAGLGGVGGYGRTRRSGVRRGGSSAGGEGRARALWSVAESSAGDSAM